MKEGLQVRNHRIKYSLCWYRVILECLRDLKAKRKRDFWISQPRKNRGLRLLHSTVTFHHQFFPLFKIRTRRSKKLIAIRGDWPEN
jgi:hypothetical protein